MSLDIRRELRSMLDTKQTLETFHNTVSQLWERLLARSRNSSNDSVESIRRDQDIFDGLRSNYNKLQQANKRGDIWEEKNEKLWLSAQARFEACNVTLREQVERAQNEWGVVILTPPSEPYSPVDCLQQTESPQSPACEEIDNLQLWCVKEKFLPTFQQAQVELDAKLRGESEDSSHKASLEVLFKCSYNLAAAEAICRELYADSHNLSVEDKVSLDSAITEYNISHTKWSSHLMNLRGQIESRTGQGDRLTSVKLRDRGCTCFSRVTERRQPGKKRAHGARHLDPFEEWMTAYILVKLSRKAKGAHQFAREFDREWKARFGKGNDAGSAPRFSYDSASISPEFIRHEQIHPEGEQSEYHSVSAGVNQFSPSNSSISSKGKDSETLEWRQG